MTMRTHRTDSGMRIFERARIGLCVLVALFLVGGLYACNEDRIVNVAGHFMSHASPEHQVGAVGIPVADPPAVVIQNRRGAGVPDVSVVFFVSGGAGGAIFPDSVTTDSAGVARTSSWTLGPEEGVHEVTAMLSFESQSAEIEFAALASSNPPTSVIPTSPASQLGTVGRPVPFPPEVTIRDALGLGVPGVAVTFVAGPGSGTVEPSQVMTNNEGRAALFSWTLGPTEGATNTVTASVQDSTIAGGPIVFTATGNPEGGGGGIVGDPTFLWTSDWGGSTGNSRATIQDNGLWPDRVCVGGDGALIRVVNADATIAGLPDHWPTNLLQVDHNGQNCDAVLAQNQWTAPAVGDTIWFRVLAWLDKCGLNTGPVHNVQSNAGSIAWTITEDQCEGGQVPIGFKSYFLGGGIQWSPGFNIPDSTALRYEWGLIRESETQYDALVKIYDDRTGTLLFDESTLRQYNGQTLVTFNQTSGFNYSGVGPDVTFRSWILGQQGPGLASGQRTGAYYYGGAAVCNPGPCGPYTAGEGGS